MEAQLEQLEGDRVRLTVEVPADEVAHAVEHATHDLAERVRVPGFRRGRVPEAVLVQRLGRQRVYSEAVESHIGSWFWSAARTNRVRPSEQPAYSYKLPKAEDESWQFTAEFPVQGAAEPADWTKLEVPRFDVEVEDEVVDAELAALQETAASLSAVDGRFARRGDVAVVDIDSEDGPGQRDYVVPLGTGEIVDELEEGIRDLSPGESREVSWDLGNGTTRSATVTLKDLYEKVLPPLDDDLAKTASEFDTLEELRTSIIARITKLIEEQVESRFRVDAVDELIKASEVRPARLLVEMRTRDLLNAFIRQLDARGIDPNAYLQAAGVTATELQQRLAAEAVHSLARELVLEGVANRVGIEVTDDDIRTDLRDEGESEEDIEEFMEAGGADRVRSDLRLRRAVDRVASEVIPISKELADARGSIWTPGKEEGESAEKKLWIPGS
jgi:trigger factor